MVLSMDSCSSLSESVTVFGSIPAALANLIFVRLIFSATLAQAPSSQASATSEPNSRS